MNVSQDIQVIIQDENSYDDTITITDVPQGQFVACTENLSNGSTRAIRVQLLELAQSAGGTMTANSGLFVRQDGENEIKVTVLDVAGSEVATNTASYPN